MREGMGRISRDRACKPCGSGLCSERLQLRGSYFRDPNLCTSVGLAFNADKEGAEGRTFIITSRDEGPLSQVLF